MKAMSDHTSSEHGEVSLNIQFLNHNHHLEHVFCVFWCLIWHSFVVLARANMLLHQVDICTLRQQAAAAGHDTAGPVLTIGCQPEANAGSLPIVNCVVSAEPGITEYEEVLAQRRHPDRHRPGCAEPLDLGCCLGGT